MENHCNIDTRDELELNGFARNEVNKSKYQLDFQFNSSLKSRVKNSNFKKFFV